MARYKAEVSLTVGFHSGVEGDWPAELLSVYTELTVVPAEPKDLRLGYAWGTRWTLRGHQICGYDPSQMGAVSVGFLLKGHNT